MMPHCDQNAQQAKHRWLSLPSILTAEILITTLDPVGLAAAAECQVTEDGAMAFGMTTGKGATSSILPLITARKRDSYGEVVSFPVSAGAPYVKNSRTALSNRDDQTVGASSACVSQDILKSELFNRAMVKSIGKSQVQLAHTATKVTALPYNGKRQVHTIGMIPPEIGVSIRSKLATTIRPVWEGQRPTPTVESFSQLGNQPLVELNPFARTSQQPGNEFFLMNLTSEQVLHDGNCGSGCP